MADESAHVAVPVAVSAPAPPVQKQRCHGVHVDGKSSPSSATPSFVLHPTAVGCSYMAVEHRPMRITGKHIAFYGDKTGVSVRPSLPSPSPSPSPSPAKRPAKRVRFNSNLPMTCSPLASATDMKKRQTVSPINEADRKIKRVVDAMKSVSI